MSERLGARIDVRSGLIPTGRLYVEAGLSEGPVQRRLAAILAADVVGYSALMEHAEEITYARIGALRRELIQPCLTRYQGRLIKTTGDGFFAEFASPVAAVRCALEIQEHLSATDNSLRLRIGINLGDVIVDHQGDVYGDGINIAARLESIADPGGIMISSKVYNEVEANIDIEFEDRGDRQLKNISRPVRTYAVATSGQNASQNATIVAAPGRPSIAVLPFQNMSDDPEQEYFADGIVEDIITALSRFRSLLVIARNTSFTYKGKTIDIKRVGQELGVRYVLEGSVRKASSRVRITGQLIEAETGTHLWADKFDGALKDVFDLQDQVTSRVVGAIAPAVQLAETERARRKPTSNLDSYDLFLRGSSAVWEGRLRDAIAHLKRAIESDPRYAEAHGLCAGAYVVLQSYSGELISSDERVEAIRFADLAATLGTDDALTLVRAAQALAYFDQQYERAIAMSDRAVALNPNLTTAWLVRGWINSMGGNVDESMKSFFRVLQFSEVDPARIGAYSGLSYGCFDLRKYEEGCAWAEQALQKYENALYLFPLIANAFRAGRNDEARSAVTRLLKIAPEFKLSPMWSHLSRRRKGTDDLYVALRDAGVPS